MFRVYSSRKKMPMIKATNDLRNTHKEWYRVKGQHANVARLGDYLAMESEIHGVSSVYEVQEWYPECPRWKLELVYGKPERPMDRIDKNDNFYRFNTYRHISKVVGDEALVDAIDDLLADCDELQFWKDVSINELALYDRIPLEPSGHTMPFFLRQTNNTSYRLRPRRLCIVSSITSEHVTLSWDVGDGTWENFPILFRNSSKTFEIYRRP